MKQYLQTLGLLILILCFGMGFMVLVQMIAPSPMGMDW